jgi:hypothetical protein
MTQKGAVSSTGTSTMTACRQFIAICFGLAAWFWCTAGTFVQQRPVPAQPVGAGSWAGVVAASDFPWHVDLRPVLDEAMRRSGARSELEAIVAGLRSLRAPSPRNIEPETANPPAER